MIKLEVENTSKNNESIAGISFTPKEIVIIREIVAGESYKVIASRLSMSTRTIEYHIRNIMNKIGCNSKSELMAFFNENGIFPDEKCHSNYVTFFIKNRSLIITLFVVITAISVSLLYFYENRKNIAITDMPKLQENFLERSDLVDKIMKILESQEGIKTVVLIGGGGSGKTTVGREVLSLLKSPIRWEINAETSDSIFNSFFDLASHMANTPEIQKDLEIIKNLQDFEEKKKKLIKLSSRLLKQSKYWCLLFDNVDAIKYVNPYLPRNADHWGNGKVIITTRNEDIADVSFIKSSCVINIGLLTEEEQQKLFCDILYKSDFNRFGLNSPPLAAYKRL